MRVLVTGAGGQLARELVSVAPSRVQLRTVTRAECDITDFASVEHAFDSFQPDIVINTAAYTSVDAAEENQELAFSVNARGAENVARATKALGARLTHISTDYVFDGHRSTPYPPDAATNPASVYGASKAEGEKLVLRAAPSSVIIRTGWLYSTVGANFLVSIMKALRASRPLSVVSDRTGCPTSTHDFAIALWQTSDIDLRGIYHWANAGSASWYDFAREIAQIAQRLGLLQEAPEICAVTSREYPQRASRPPYSVLDTTALITALKVTPSSWQQALLEEMTRWVSPDLG